MQYTTRPAQRERCYQLQASILYKWVSSRSVPLRRYRDPPKEPSACPSALTCSWVSLVQDAALRRQDWTLARAVFGGSGETQLREEGRYL